MCTKACTSTRTTTISSCSASTDADELMGLPLLDLMDESFADEFRAKIRTFRDDSNDEVSFEFRGRTTSGEPDGRADDAVRRRIRRRALHAGAREIRRWCPCFKTPCRYCRTACLRSTTWMWSRQCPCRRPRSTATAIHSTRHRRFSQRSSPAHRNPARCSSLRSTISTRCRSNSGCCDRNRWSRNSRKP